jgi:hypothetical protein
MATTSTAVTARTALHAALNTGELQNKSHFGWPGPPGDGENERLYINGLVDWTQAIPNIKAGRVQRQETFTFELVLDVVAPELTSADLADAMARAFVLAAVVENALANDVQLGETGIQRFELTGREYAEEPYEKGWRVLITMSVEVHARLT